MKNGILEIIVTVTIGIIFIGSLLAVTINEYSTSTAVYENDGVPYAEYDGEEHTIVVSYDGTKTTITTDGKVCETPNFTLFAGGASIVYGSDAYIRLNGLGNIRAFSDNFYAVNATAGNDVTIVLTSTNAAITVGTTTTDVPITPLAYIASEGEYTLSTSPSVAEDSIIIAGTTALTGSDYISFLANGTIDDLTVGNAYSKLPTGITITDTEAVVNTTEVVTNLVRIDSVVFTATLSDSSTETGTYTYFLAPKEIQYDNPQYVGDYGGLFSAIIIIAVAALLLIGVRAITGNRD